MKTVTARVPEDLLEDLEEIEHEERADRAEVIRRLLADAVRDWKVERALEELRDGKITLRTSAKRAGLTYVEMLDRAEEAGIAIGYTEEDLQKDLAGLEEKE